MNDDLDDLDDIETGDDYGASLAADLARITGVSGYGACPNCGQPLSNWGAASDGDGDVYDEIGCDSCEEVVRKDHASYCRCDDCREGIQKQHEVV